MPSVEDDYKDSASQLPKCCCCHVWHDEFERAAINTLETAWGDVAVKRYSFGEVTVDPGEFGYPGLIDFETFVPNGWSIVGGALSCSVAGDGIQCGPSSGFDTSSFCFDMTFTGSGQVYYGFAVIFEFDNDRLRIRSLQNNNDGYWMPFLWSSGATYRIRINHKQYGGVEIWIDDVQIWNCPTLSASQGNWFFTGSGTLAIDNLDIYTLGVDENPFEEYFEPYKGYPECFRTGPCWFPWLDDGTGENPPQIQIEITNVVGQCGPCPWNINLAQPSPGVNGTYILDLVACDNSFGNYVSCACYELQGSFGCYDYLTVSFGQNYEVHVVYCHYTEEGGVGQTTHCTPFAGGFAGTFFGLTDPDPPEPNNKLVYESLTTTLTASLNYPPPATQCYMQEITITIPEAP